MTTDDKVKIDLNHIERVKHIYGNSPARSVRVYYRDHYREYDDPGGRLYEAFRTLGVYCS